MQDFRREELKLNVNARTVLNRVDEALKTYRDRKIDLPTLRLYKDQYQVLNDALLAASKSKISLKTHSYRGVTLVGMK